jgi:hypothetical protein
MSNNDGQRRYRGNYCGSTYGLAFLGAVIYFIQHSTSFWMGVLGVIKAIVWPALVVYKVLDFFKM